MAPCWPRWRGTRCPSRDWLSPRRLAARLGKRRHATIKLWNVADGSLLATLAGHSLGVTDIAVSPDGTLLVSSSQDQTMILWSLPDGAR
jgi:WD40 repeat protein